MKRVLCPQLPTATRPVPVEEREAHHLQKVMRLRDGDTVEAMDGRGGIAVATLRLRSGKLFLELSDAPASAPAGAEPAPILLEAAVLKGDAMEWMIEKAVEIGVAELVPLLTAHTVVQVSGKGPEAFQERWQKIADQALKQCGRARALRVHAPIALEARLVQVPTCPEGPRLWADEESRTTTPSLLSWALQNHPPSTTLLIGPEGGWSARERELLARETAVSLGPWVLRAETAAIWGAGLLVAAHREART